MNSHPYFRAYLAGIALPTPLLLLAIAGFTVAHHLMEVPLAAERAIIFPMAVVPNAWGLWNILYVALLRREQNLPIGVHGAMLPLLLIPAGYSLSRVVGLSYWTPTLALIAIPLALLCYYLAWKFLVNYCNRLLGIA
ncbi:MAG: hypothetical protein NTY38_13865 [Acidobacteria bacterium]|nr:hypothetical protein [Acidobacteriota bacterium]